MAVISLSHSLNARDQSTGSEKSCSKEAILGLFSHGIPKACWCGNSVPSAKAGRFWNLGSVGPANHCWCHICPLVTWSSCLFAWGSWLCIWPLYQGCHQRKRYFEITADRLPSHTRADNRVETQGYKLKGKSKSTLNFPWNRFPLLSKPLSYTAIDIISV